ncbi:MAG: ABC transporter ATP-binding protein [Chthoniobacteraceae bacterium]
MSFLEVHNVRKSYAGAHVLANIDLSIEEGEFVAIIGYSGSGKTTLMSLLAGLIKPDHGTVKLEGREIAGPGPDRGIVFQNYSLLPWLTVYENVALAVDQVFPQWTADERRKHTEKYIRMVNLEPARNKVPRELSGGMRQRVSVARTLALEPHILLLDEPLSALDALTRASLQDEISRIWQESRKTVVLVTNDPDEALLLADRVIPLSAGPGATLLESIPVHLERPRDRRTLLEDREFKRLRNEIVDQLLGSKKTPTAALTKKLVLPDIQPEDISITTSRALFGAKRKAKRPGEKQVVKVEVEL